MKQVSSSAGARADAIDARTPEENGAPRIATTGSDGVPATFTGRVVFVNRFVYPDHSATSQILSDLAESLARRGWKVMLLGSRQLYDDPAAALPARDHWGAIDIRRSFSTRFGRANLLGRAVDYLSFYLSAFFCLLTTLRQGDILVCKTDPPLMAVPAFLAARLRCARRVNWLQDLFPEAAQALGEPPIPAALGTALRWLRNRTLQAASLNVVIGKRMAERVSTETAGGARVAVVPNWAHEDVIEPIPPDRSYLRRSLGLAEKFVVAYSGNLGRAHDAELLKSMLAALARDTGIHSLFIGGGHGYKLLASAAATAGWKHVSFLPYRPLQELGDSMAAADLHLVSLKPELEGLIVPSKFFGIAAAGRACLFIGASHGELADLVKEADCGVVYSGSSGAELADLVRALACDGRRVAGMGERARALLDGKLSRECALSRWNECLREVAW